MRDRDYTAAGLTGWLVLLLIFLTWNRCDIVNLDERLSVLEHAKPQAEGAP